MAVVVGLTLAATAGAPVAVADGRDQLAQAIATTRGSYLVYNFGGGYPAPMLKRRGQLVRDDQRRTPDDHQVGLTAPDAAAAGRHPHRLSGPLRTDTRGAHPGGPGAGVGDLQPAAGVAGARPADHRDQRQLLRCTPATGWLMEVHRMQFPAGRLRRQHPRAGPRQRGGDGHAGLRGQAGAVRRRRGVDGAIDDDPAGGRRAVPGDADKPRRLRRRLPGDPGRCSTRAPGSPLSAA